MSVFFWWLDLIMRTRPNLRATEDRLPNDPFLSVP